jgi:hypothetical protein
MSDLPPHPDLTQLRHQAKDLLRAARNGDPAASARIRAVSDRQNLSAAQLAVAREYGFASWMTLLTEVRRRVILSDRDLDRLTALIAENPELATEQMKHWCDHPGGPAPLSYVAMLRYDTARRRWRDRPGTGAIARMLLQAGAPVDGSPDDPETPLITAASYGDIEVARVLIQAGANLDATASPTAGGVPGGTALRHAAVFGMTDVVDVLVAAGARIDHISQAAAAGDITGWLRPDTPIEDRVRALVMAADHERLHVIDQLLGAGTPIDAADPWGRQPLHTAAMNGRVAAVAHLLARGADPNHKDATYHRTALDWCRHHNPGDSPRHTEIAAILQPVTKPDASR